MYKLYKKNLDLLKSIALTCILFCQLSLAIEPNLEDAPIIKIETSMGNISIVLAQKQAPKTVANFLNYVNDQYYNDTIFHRVIAKFMIQGGGLTESLHMKAGFPAIKNESSNGLSNRRGSVSMARTNDPDSATSQFFINVVDNTRLDASEHAPGYTVFGYVIEGMNVVDRISKVATTTKSIYADVPVEPIKILNVYVIKAN